MRVLIDLYVSSDPPALEWQAAFSPILLAAGVVSDVPVSELDPALVRPIDQHVVLVTGATDGLGRELAL